MRLRASDRLPSLAFLLLSSLNSAFLYGQSPEEIRSGVEALLDSWSDRASTRDKILNLGPETRIVKTLVSIAQSESETDLRRSRAIALLATFNTKESFSGLSQVTEGGEPSHRCLAIHALAELGSKETVPVLVRKLDDRSVCMTLVSTDPYQEHSVFVSDEAVRALERVTGTSFGETNSVGHRPTKPWKAWWSRHKKAYSSVPR
jgi:hypothetical protein